MPLVPSLLALLLPLAGLVLLARRPPRRQPASARGPVSPSAAPRRAQPTLRLAVEVLEAE